MTKIEIEQLKASYPIENVIGETVKLERKGTNYVGLCPSTRIITVCWW